MSLKTSVYAGYRRVPNFIVVLIGLVIIFKNQLTSIVGNIFEKITSQSSSI